MSFRLEGPSRGGEDNVVARSVEELHPELPFQGADQLADCWLRDVELLRGPMEAACLRYGYKASKVPQFHPAQPMAPRLTPVPLSVSPRLWMLAAVRVFESIAKAPTEARAWFCPRSVLLRANTGDSERPGLRPRVGEVASRGRSAPTAARVRPQLCVQRRAPTCASPGFRPGRALRSIGDAGVNGARWRWP